MFVPYSIKRVWLDIITKMLCIDEFLFAMLTIRMKCVKSFDVIQVYRIVIYAIGIGGAWRGMFKI